MKETDTYNLIESAVYTARQVFEKKSQTGVVHQITRDGRIEYA